MNAGIPGYATEHELKRLPSWMDEFRPRAAVVVYVLNDAIPDVIEPDDRTLATTEKDDAAQSSMPAIWRLLRNVVEAPRSRRDLELWYESFYLGDRADCWVRTRARMNWRQRR